MRGADSKQEAMFSYVSPEARVPAKHPLRPIRAMIAEALAQAYPRFEAGLRRRALEQLLRRVYRRASPAARAARTPAR